jgi:hypothetical protein
MIPIEPNNFTIKKALHLPNEAQYEHLMKYPFVICFKKTCPKEIQTKASIIYKDEI